MWSNSWDRQFHWASSVRGEAALLDALERHMTAFYQKRGRRRDYQNMVDDARYTQPETERALTTEILRLDPSSVLEVGCGSGRLYRRLTNGGYSGLYTGIEISADLIRENQTAHPEAAWVCGSVYSAPLSGDVYDVVLAYFVLEHCVYPCAALDRLMRYVRPGGSVFLVFPDFVVMGRLASQALGLSRGTARDHLRRGAFAAALLALYDSRVRLPTALRWATAHHGPFPVNLNPRCLIDADSLEPDVDAVYIASKAEVRSWAIDRGFVPSFPAGCDGHFSENVLVRIDRPGPIPQ